MDKKIINENLLIERYLKDTLSVKEREAFEERFLSSDELLDELEAAERLRQGLQDVVALEKAHASEKPASHVVAMFHSPRYAMAASFLLLISLGVSSILFQQNTRLTEIDTSRAAATEIVPLVSVRGTMGSDPVNTLLLGDTQKQFVIMLDPGFDAYSHFRATVYRLDPAEGKSMLWRVDKMIPGYEDMLALALPSSALSAGEFEVQLEGWRNEWPAGHGFDPIDSLTFRCIDK